MIPSGANLLLPLRFSVKTAFGIEVRYTRSRFLSNSRSFYPRIFADERGWYIMLRSTRDQNGHHIMSQTQPVMGQLYGTPLTTLSEDETMFRASVREFAGGEVRPRVEHMDEVAKLDPAIISHCFQLGLMGIETPEEFGGAGANFFTAILAVEELSRVDASVGVFVDVQNTLVNNAFIRWGNPDQKRKYLTKLAAES